MRKFKNSVLRRSIIYLVILVMINLIVMFVMNDYIYSLGIYRGDPTISIFDYFYLSSVAVWIYLINVALFKLWTFDMYLFGFGYFILAGHYLLILASLYTWARNEKRYTLIILLLVITTITVLNIFFTEVIATGLYGDWR